MPPPRDFILHALIGGFFGVRVGIAFIAGWSIYLFAAITDVLLPLGGIDAVVGCVFQLIMGAIFTALALALVIVAGLPWTIRPFRHLRWSRFILCLMIAVLGVWLLIAARLPWNLQTVPHPDLSLSAAGTTIQTAHMTMSIAGWLAMMFGIVHATPGLSRPNRMGDLGKRVPMIEDDARPDPNPPVG